MMMLLKELHFGVFGMEIVGERDYKPMSGRTDYPLLFGRSFEKKLAYQTVIKLVK